MISLHIRRSDQAADSGYRENFHVPAIKIGSLPSSTLRLQGDKVSRMHAVLEVFRDRAAAQLIDLGSLHGTSVNGAKLGVGSASKVELKVGDVIIIGEYALDVLAIEADPQSAFDPARATQPASTRVLETMRQVAEEREAKLLAGMAAITDEEVARAPTSELIAGLAAFTLGRNAYIGDDDDEEPDEVVKAFDENLARISAEIDRRLPGPVTQ